MLGPSLNFCEFFPQIFGLKSSEAEFQKNVRYYSSDTLQADSYESLLRDEGKKWGSKPVLACLAPLK